MAKKETTVAEQLRDYAPPLPKQVKAQVEQAEALIASMNGQDQPAPEVAASVEPPTSQPGPPEAEPPQSEAPPPAEDDQSWEQRFRSQQGRLEQATRTNQALSDRLTQMEDMLTEMKIKGVAEHMNEPAPKSYQRLLSEEEMNDYGDEFLNVVGKRSREELAPEFDSLAERLQRIEGRLDGVGNVIERGATQELYAGLTEYVPEWRDINRSEEFKAWLQMPDPFSGRRRHDMLTEAYTRHETGRVVNFFRGFLTEATGLPQNSSGQGQSAPPLPKGQGSGKPTLESFAAPGRARSAPQSLPPDKPIYTTAWIEKFMADKRTGKFRGREADADAIERDIFQAQHEGRIQ